jgi:hypothetical protein
MISISSALSLCSLREDVINEGELEGFAGMYSFGWAQRAIAELEVPVYITAGNHDIGGWTNTPPPAGSARRNWWRYFGGSGWTMPIQTGIPTPKLLFYLRVICST